MVYLETANITLNNVLIIPSSYDYIYTINYTKFFSIFSTTYGYFMSPLKPFATFEIKPYFLPETGNQFLRLS